jgi:hypothetical protein
MAETLNFREAVERAGVSRQRLNEAIRSGRLPATRGGGPGRPTTIQLEDLQRWCVSEGLAMPVETGEHLERLPPSAIMERLERLDEMFAGMQRLEQLMTEVLERLERSEAQAIAASPIQAPSQPPRASSRPEQRPPLPHDRASIIAYIRQARDVEHQQFQDIAEALNATGIPTFSGRGKWHKANVRRFYLRSSPG